MLSNRKYTDEDILQMRKELYDACMDNYVGCTLDSMTSFASEFVLVARKSAQSAEAYLEQSQQEADSLYGRATKAVSTISQTDDQDIPKMYEKIFGYTY